MKKYSLLLILFCVVLTSFKQPVNVKDKTLYFFYVDYSLDKSKSTKPFSDEMLNTLSTKLNDINSLPNAELSFYLSDVQPKYTTMVKSAQGFLKNLETTSLPICKIDNKEVNTKLLEHLNSNIKSVEINLFVTENFLSNELIKSDAGVFLNGLPKKLQTLLNCEESDIKLNIFFPLGSKTVTQDDLKKFFNFQNISGGGKIQYNIFSI